MGGLHADHKVHRSVDEGRLSMQSEARVSMQSEGGARSSGFDDDGMAEGPKGMVLPFQPLSISFDKICYSVDTPEVSECRVKCVLCMQLLALYYFSQGNVN